MRVLVVDDNADAADVLATLLSLLNCTVQVAYAGSEALKLGELHRPQCVFLDVNMPQMDGCQTARRMRERRWGRLACIVALTANDDEDTRRRTMQAGMDHHLAKPVSTKTLLDILEAVRG